MKLLKILIVLLTVLSGCTPGQKYRQFNESLFRPDHEFVIKACDIREGCYGIENEMEAAVLMVNLINEGDRTTAILTEKSLDMNKAFAYALSISPAPFDLEYSIRPMIDQQVRLNIKMTVQDEQALSNNQKQAETIVAEVAKKGNDPVRDLHDWIITHTCYDEKATELDDLQRSLSPSYHATGVFDNGTATCSGYAEAYHLLLTEAGIGSMKVFSNTMNHAWNLVNVDQEMKYIDATFDDPVPDVKEGVRYEYYQMSEQTLTENYVFDPSGSSTLNREETEGFFDYCFGK